jgi:hypothetical protein
MNKTTENLWRALENYVPPDTPSVIYRLIYDLDTGKPLNVITSETDLQHIVITKEEADTYPHQDPRVRVVNNKIVKHIKKLQSQEIPNTLKVFIDVKGHIATDDYNMLIINNSGNNRWNYD